MTTTTSDQGLVLPVASDGDNVPLHVGLYNTGVESRLVKRYANTTDRGTRNPTPTEGELSYLLDSDRYETYTGTAWVSVVLGEKGVNNNIVAGTTTSGTYVDMPATSSITSFVKQLASTVIKVEMHAGLLSTAVNTIARFGVRINGVDFDVTECVLNQASLHLRTSGTKRCTGIPAGTYTIQGRWYRTTGAGTLTIGNDWFSMNAAEVL